LPGKKQKDSEKQKSPSGAAGKDGTRRRGAEEKTDKKRKGPERKEKTDKERKGSGGAPELVGAQAVKRFLTDKGLGTHLGIFAKNGVDSLQVLQEALGSSDLRTKIRKEIAKTKGGEAPAKVFDRLKAEDVRTAIIKNEKVPDEAAEKKKEQLREAVDEVKKLNEDYKAAREKNDSAQLAKVRKDYGSLRDRLEKGNLGTLPDLPGEEDKLGGALSTSLDLITKGNEKLSKGIERTKLTALGLVYEHKLLYGRLIDATGVKRADGGELLDVPDDVSDTKLLGNPSDYGERVTSISRDYKGSGALSTEKHLIEGTGSSFSTIASVSGSGFVGTGVAAFSVAASYSTTKKQERDEEKWKSETVATQTKENYSFYPMTVVTFDTRHLHLSSDAKADVAEISKLPPGQKQRRKVVSFYKNWGSHAISRYTLGGWYRLTAEAKSKTDEEKAKLESTVADAMKWGVEASASYRGLGGSVSGGTSTAGEVRHHGGDLLQMSYSVESLTVDITTTYHGGVGGLPRDMWEESLQFNPQWAIVNSNPENAKAVWDLIGDDEDFGQPLADLFEEVWVQDIFAPSIPKDWVDYHHDPLPALCVDVIKEKGTRTAEELVAYLEAANKPLPKNATELFDQKPPPKEGENYIFLDGVPEKRVRLYCVKGSKGSPPREYLTLPNRNYSQVKAGKFYHGTTIETVWSRIRLNPETLEVDLEDFSYSKSTGGPITAYNAKGSETGKFELARFGMATACGGDGVLGYATIDLRDTGFKFDPTVTFGSIASWHDTGKVETHDETFARYYAAGGCSEYSPMINNVRRLKLALSMRPPDDGPK